MNPFATVTTGPAAEGVSTLPVTLRLGPVSLTVTDLDRSVAWYQSALGLRVHRHDVDVAALGDGTEDVLVLHEDSTAQRPRRHSGLYHYALLFPTREELARAALRLAATRTPIQGASDHGTHEALYLADPDGNGIELAADRPRDQWPSPEEEFSGGGPRPLDFDALLASVAGEEPSPQVRPGLRMGHVHLHVADVPRGLAFYRDVIGFDVWALMPSAAFVAAGGYHHHLGFNTWRGEHIGPAPAAGVVGLRHWTIVLATVDEVAAVRERVRAARLASEDVAGGFAVTDPFGMTVRVVVTA
ncbi:Catechol-2,3-dioxygenase [Baekduia alba]|uniref:VOC family protein n=1 Tax=Baekduia alba TaxID=2997333 RepID=UPI0023409609|nr:VOC family protein [Baekduia alba]WCB94506.1 Catechol-2,3-dioxygenase [Baekduia alba]